MPTMNHDKCSICGERIFADFKKHVIKKAHHEAWLFTTAGVETTPHLTFYLQNSKQEPNIIITKRHWTI